MSEADADYDIKLIALVLDLQDAFDEDNKDNEEVYGASFGFERDERRFTITVWFPAEGCPTVDLVRIAMGRLHLMLAQLARQTESWRLDV